MNHFEKKISPRKNLPANLARKRMEDNFVLAFARSFVRAHKKSVLLSARELPLHGFGIADFVCVIKKSKSKVSNLEDIREKDISFFAFEIKLKDWREALSQAFRYKYFANFSIVVLPTEDIEVARKYLNTFRALDIGLWAFDKKEKIIDQIYTPALKTPFSKKASHKALSLLAPARIKFRLVA